MTEYLRCTNCDHINKSIGKSGSSFCCNSCREFFKVTNAVKVDESEYIETESEEKVAQAVENSIDSLEDLHMATKQKISYVRIEDISLGTVWKIALFNALIVLVLLLILFLVFGPILLS